MCVEPPQKQALSVEAEHENQDGQLQVSYVLGRVTSY